MQGNAYFLFVIFFFFEISKRFRCWSSDRESDCSGSKRKQDCPRTMAQLPRKPMRLTTSACGFSINLIKFCKKKKKKNQIKTREVAHKIKQLPINIRTLSSTIEVYLERFRRNLLCKTIIKLIHHATVSKCPKLSIFLKQIWNQAFTADPIIILKFWMKSLGVAICSYYTLYINFRYF